MKTGLKNTSYKFRITGSQFKLKMFQIKIYFHFNEYFYYSSSYKHNIILDQSLSSQYLP